MKTYFEQLAVSPVALVYRTVALRIPAFDRLKIIQRELEAEAGRSMTNAEVISAAIYRWPLK